MKQYLNTLYVTTQGAWLSREGESVLVRVEKETRLRVPVHTIGGGIVCFGRVSYSPFLMKLCADRGVRISHFTEQGRFIARIEGSVSGNVLLRRRQYRAADDPDCAAAVAGSVVAAKITNSRVVLQRALRDHPDGPGCPIVRSAIDRLGSLLSTLQDDIGVDTIRGLEGDAARAYFGAFDHLVTVQKDAFFFRQRSRRPPLDNLNALLSFIYSVLAHDAASALEGVGLDPAVGFLHTDRPGRPSLALDLMEELRPFLADRLVLSLVNQRQVEPAGFTTSESWAVMMDENTRKSLLVAFQKRKQEEIRHPFLGETITVGMLIHIQALLLARFLRGDLDAYPAFLWR